MTPAKRLKRATRAIFDTRLNVYRMSGRLNRAFYDCVRTGARTQPRASSASVEAPGPSRSEVVAPAPGTALGLSSCEVSDCSAWVL